MDTSIRLQQARSAKQQRLMLMATESPELRDASKDVNAGDYLINHSGMIQDWISARSGLAKCEHFRGIARMVRGRIVAAFGFDWFQDSSCMLHTACDEPWGYNRWLLYKAFSAPFEQWDYNCLMSVIQSGNAKSLNLAKRLGFKEFATLPGAHPSGALHYVAMYKADCRWLRLAENLR